MLLSGLLRIFQSWLSVLLSILRLLGSVSLTLWRWQHSTRMLRRRRLLLFCMCLFTSLLVSGISPVSADEGDTPTATFEPLWPTQTPAPTQVSSCPVGQPAGMYTVTPDSQWLSQCLPCITQTPYYQWPTSTITPFATDFPWVTPSTGTPEVTPTGGILPITPQPTFENPTDIYMGGYSGYKVYLGQIQSFDTGGHTTIYDQPSVEFSIITGSDVPSQVTTTWQTNIYLNSSSDCIGSDSTYWFAVDNAGSSVPVTAWFDGVEYTVAAGQTQRVTYATGKPPLSIHATVSISYPGYGHPTNPQKAGVIFGTSINAWGGCGTNHGLSGTFSWTGGIVGNEPTATVTPTVTPTPDSYCNVVHSQAGSSDETAFQLPTIRVGSSTCLPLGNFDIPMSWVSNILSGMNIPESIHVPGITLCFKQILFGDVNLFGLQIDLDLLAIIMSAIVTLRLVTRS